MNLKHISGLVLLFVLLAFPVSASTVSFLVVETGLSDEAPNVQYSSLWEGGLMDTFFEAGHIVTNNPILRVKQKPLKTLSGELKDDYDDAYLSGVDYLIICFLSYNTQGETAIPFEMAIKVYSTTTEVPVYEQTFLAGSGTTLREEYQIAQNAGKVIASKIKD